MNFIFDVGANDGKSGVDIRKQITEQTKINENDIKIIAFEPHPKFIEKIKNNNYGKNYLLVEKAVSDTEGIFPFYFCNDGGASSLCKFKANTTLDQIWRGREDVKYAGKKIDVEVIRLDSFIEEYNKNNPKEKIENILFLHVDAQGKDLNVLKSLGKYIINVHNGVIEVARDETASIYEDQQSFISNASQFLIENKFKISSPQPNDVLYNEFNIYFGRNQ